MTTLGPRVEQTRMRVVRNRLGPKAITLCLMRLFACDDAEPPPAAPRLAARPQSDGVPLAGYGAELSKAGIAPQTATRKANAPSAMLTFPCSYRGEDSSSRRAEARPHIVRDAVLQNVIRNTGVVPARRENRGPPQPRPSRRSASG